MDMYFFGERVRYFRELADLTQAQFGERIGKSPHHVSDIERGLSFPSIPVFYDMCRELDVPADCFFNSDNRVFAEFSAFRALSTLEQYENGELRKVFDTIQNLRLAINKEQSAEMPEKPQKES